MKKLLVSKFFNISSLKINQHRVFDFKENVKHKKIVEVDSHVHIFSIECAVNCGEEAESFEESMIEEEFPKLKKMGDLLNVWRNEINKDSNEVGAVLLPIDFSSNFSFIPRYNYYVQQLVTIALAGLKNPEMKKAYLRIKDDLCDAELIQEDDILINLVKSDGESISSFDELSAFDENWGKFLPACAVYPESFEKDDVYRRFVMANYEELGSVCFKVYPSLGFNPENLDKEAPSFIQYCLENNIPIIAHGTKKGLFTGKNPFVRNIDNNPDKWDSLMKKQGIENLRICIAHFGGAEEIKKCDLKDKGDETWTKKVYDILNNDSRKNVYTCISNSDGDINALNDIKKWLDDDEFKVLRDRIIFGTDYWVVGGDVGDIIKNTNSTLHGFMNNIGLNNLMDFLNI